MKRSNYRQNRAGGISCDIESEEYGTIPYALSQKEIDDLPSDTVIKEFEGELRKPDKNPAN